MMHASHFAMLLGTFLVLTIAAAAAFSAWILRQELIENWRDQLGNMSLILAEKTSQEINAGYFVLGSIADGVKNANIKDADDLRQRMAILEIHDILHDRTSGLPQIEVASIIGANGDVINFTRAYPVPPLNLADRDYFQKHAHDPDLSVHLSEPFRNKTNQKWTFYLTRRLNGAHGEFIGIALVGISCDFFMNFYKKINLGKGASISLYRRDFVLLARWPQTDSMMGKINLSGSSYTVIEKLKKNNGVLVTSSSRFAEDGRAVFRMGAPRLLDKFPLIVTLTITGDLFLADWYRVVKTLGVLTAASIAALVIAFFYLVQLLLRRERDMAATLLLQRQAEAASLAKSEFLAMMSHEIRTPLTAIIGFAEMMEMSPNSLAPGEAGQTILRNGKHLLHIINDILDLSKIEAGSMQLENIAFSPLEIMWNLDSMIGAHAHGKGIGFNTIITYPMPSKIIGDPTRWKQILFNLYGNAVKFTEAGAVKTTISYNPDRSILTCSVADSGIGMTDEQMSILFKPFSQADGTITRKYGGTGLGLHLVRQLAERMRGKVSVTSAPGKGSVFTIDILAPMAEGATLLTAESTATFESIQQTAAVPDSLHGRVLLAEDSPDNRRLIGACLRRLGLDFAFAENGEEAVQQAMTEDFDVILMDMQMPVMDGLTATELLRATGYGGPIIALTANVMSDDIERYLEKGCTYCIGKPIDFGEFTRILSELLGGTAPTASAALSAFDLPEFQHLKAEYERTFYQRLMALKACVDSGNWQETERLAHIMKGSGGTYGYPEVTHIAHSLEQHARNGAAQDATDALRQLLALDVLQKFISAGIKEAQ
jgi:hypothetical protein